MFDVIKKKLLVFVVLLCFIISFPLIFTQHVAAQTKADVKLSIVDAISIALEHNEDIKESFHRITAAQADEMIAKGVYDLTIYNETRYGGFESLSLNDYSPLEYSNATKNYLRSDTGLRQRVPTGGTIRAYYTASYDRRLGVFESPKSVERGYFTIELAQSLLKGIGDKEYQAAIKNAALAIYDSQESRNLVVSQVTLDVIRAYWTLAIAKNNLVVGQRILKMAEEISRREQVRFNEGMSQGVDVDRVRLAVEQRKYAVMQYQRDLKVAKEQLLFLMNSPNITKNMTIELTTSPTLKKITVPNEEESVSDALNMRYELRQLDIMLEQLNIDYDVNKNKLLPQLDLVLGYTTSNGNDYLRSSEAFRDTDDKSSYYAGLTFSYPLQNREARGAVKKSRQLIFIAQDRIDKTRRSIETEIKEVLHNLVLAKDGIPVAKKAYDSAIQVVKGERERFEMGGINNRDLLSSQDALGREEINYYIAQVNNNMSIAEYNFASAGLLNRYNIAILDDKAIIR